MSPVLVVGEMDHCDHSEAQVLRDSRIPQTVCAQLLSNNDRPKTIVFPLRRTSLRPECFFDYTGSAASAEAVESTCLADSRYPEKAVNIYFQREIERLIVRVGWDMDKRHQSYLHLMHVRVLKML